MKKTILIVLALVSALPVFAQFSAPRRNYVEFLLYPDYGDFVYETGENPVVNLKALGAGMPLEGVEVHYASGMDMMPQDIEGIVVLHGGEARIELPTSSKAGFRYVSVNFTVEGKQYKDMLKVGYSPKSLEPTGTLPADFDKFWKAALADARKVPLNPQVTRLDKYCTETVEVSLVKLTVGRDGRNMYGYLTVPKDGGKHPVLFCPPGAGANRISPTTFYSDRGYIYFNICIHSDLNPELSDAEYAEARKPYDDYIHEGIDSPDSFYYKAVYAGCSRCVDFLCTLPQWDGKNVGVTGGSQGGALTIVTAALNSKVTFAAAFYPALCDLPGFTRGRAGGWPKYFLGDTQEAHDRELSTLSYYDVVNFGMNVKCPVFLSYGYADESCSPTSVSVLHNVIKAPLTVEVTPDSGHWRYGESNERAMKWQEKLLIR